MSISQSESYIATNPQFELTHPGSRPKLQKGQMTVVYECLERFGPRLALADLVRHCREQGHQTNVDITKSVLYHLNLLLEGTINRIPGVQRPVIRVV